MTNYYLINFAIVIAMNASSFVDNATLRVVLISIFAIVLASVAHKRGLDKGIEIMRAKR